MNETMGIDVFHDTLAAIVAQRTKTAKNTFRSGGPRAPRALDAAGPHLVFSLGLDDAAGGGMLQRVQPIGLRYFILEGDRTIAMAQISADGSRFSNVTFGILGEAMSRAIAFAETLSEVAQNDVELRVIEVPGVYVIALWLAGEETTILIPLNPAPPPVQANRAYTVDEFEDTVARMAERKPRNERGRT